MGMLYLLTLYCAIRGFSSDRSDRSDKSDKSDRAWYSAAILACALGMGTKEVMATAPIMVLLYDYVFVSGSFKDALRKRWGLYAGLAATWLIVGAFILSTIENVQADAAKVPAVQYALAQPGVILHYLRLAFRPHPLVMEYSWPRVDSALRVAPHALVLAALFGGSVWGLWRRRWWGYAGAWFFVVLAPTSSVLSLGPHMAFEHRMYLPLAAVVAVAGIGTVRGVRQVLRHTRFRDIAAACVVVMAAGVLLPVTRARNRDYRDEERLWRENVRARPQSADAHVNLARAIAEKGRPSEAIPWFEAALRIEPGHVRGLYNWGKAVAGLGRHAEAEALLRRSLEADPKYSPAYLNLGLALAAQGKLDEAIEVYRTAVRADPRSAPAYNNLGMMHRRRGQSEEAVRAFRRATELAPGMAAAWNNLGIGLVACGRADDAIPNFVQAVKLDPGRASAYYNWGVALLELDRTDEARLRIKQALDAAPASEAIRRAVESLRFPQGDSPQGRATGR